MARRSNIYWYAAAVLFLVAAAISFTHLRFTWVNGSLHVGTVKRYHNGTDTTYFLEIPITSWIKE